MEISNEIPDVLVPRYLGDNCEVDVYNEKKVRVRKLCSCWLIVSFVHACSHFSHAFQARTHSKTRAPTVRHLDTHEPRMCFMTRLAAHGECMKNRRKF